jgi:thiamine pyrophosphate-dependent acetolactate synthase large subunit-like protein
MKLEEVAKGCGIASSHAVQDVAKFRERVQSALRTDGPHFIRAEVEALDLERPPKTKHVLDPRENKYQFAKYIERTEGVQILGGGLGNFG